MRKHLSIYVGKSLAEVLDARKKPENREVWENPAIPPELIVQYREGKKYVTGQEEYRGLMGISNIILYLMSDLPEREGQNLRKQTLKGWALKEFVVIGVSEDDEMRKQLLARNTEFTVFDYTKISENHAL